MSLETLLEQFDEVAAAPNGVQKLRELILQLAVRGRLVPQDPSDEPASVLRQRIKAGQQGLCAEGTEIKLQRLPPESDEVPYKVPVGWTWVRIGSALKLINGRAFRPSEWTSHGLPIIRIQNLNDEAAPFNHCDFGVDEKFHVQDEDLLISWSGTPGTSFGAFVWRRGPAVLNQHIFRCEILTGAFQNDFARLAVNARLDAMIGQAHGGVGLRHITKGKLENLCIVLPPLPEQRRIVEKVDQLMALCDELEERQRRGVQKRERLNRSALHHLTTTGDRSEMAQHWSLIQENFGVMFDAPETVGKLRQAIRELAVRGKLMPQEPSDERAGVLVTRIEVQMQGLQSGGSIRQPQQLAAVTPADTPFELPAGWEWLRFASIANIASNLVTPTEYRDVPHVAPDSIEKGTGRLIRYRSVGEDGVRSSKHLFSAGQILYSKIRPNLSKAVLVDFGGLCSADMYPIDAYIDARFLLNYMLSATFLSIALKNDTRVAMPKINQAGLSRIPVPVPPLPEQRRIVEKVDQLMRLCDELEARLTRARSKSEHLVASVVHHLTAA